jgi:hypothetical protein
VTTVKCLFRKPHALVIASLLLVFGCGGSSPTSDSSYPSVKGTYGSYIGLPPGSSRQTWTAPDGTVTVFTCNAVTSIPNQNGAQFSGTIERLSPCNSQATLAGEIARDGTIRFTVTQARWGACASTGTNSYAGVVNLGSMLANGRVTVLCDDGRSMVIDEQLSGSQSAPPTTG